MIDITKTEVNVLVELQKAETETVLIESYLNGVEKEKSLLEEKLGDFQTALDKLKSDFGLTNKACIDADLEMKLNDARIEKSSDNLKKVNSKDYAALLREIDNNKKRRDTLESLYLKNLEEKETQEKVIMEQEQLYLQLTQQIRSQQEDIDRKSQADRERLEEHRLQRRQIAETLNPHILSRFNEISQASGGLAVVEVRDEVCRGCFMNIPPQLYIEIRRCTSLIQCPHCNKILYHIEVLSQ
ncbi:MAG: nucleotide-binding protein [Desulfamplus sp.]|nr:nucleotide-binding protein [Desulfamplus sp.]